MTRGKEVKLTVPWLTIDSGKSIGKVKQIVVKQNLKHNFMNCKRLTENISIRMLESFSLFSQTKTIKKCSLLALTEMRKTPEVFSVNYEKGKRFWEQQKK